MFNCPTALIGQTWTYHLSEQHHEISHSQSPQRPPGLHPEKQALQRQPNHSLPSPERHLAGTGRVHHRYPGVRHRGGRAALNRSSVEFAPRPRPGSRSPACLVRRTVSQGIGLISDLPQTWICQLRVCPAKSTLCRKNIGLGMMALHKAP